jgi:hypothetical protein
MVEFRQSRFGHGTLQPQVPSITAADYAAHQRSVEPQREVGASFDHLIAPRNER